MQFPRKPFDWSGTQGRSYNVLFLEGLLSRMLGSATSSTQQTGSSCLSALWIRAVHGPTWWSRRQQRQHYGRRWKHLPILAGYTFFSRFLASQPESQPFSFTCSNLRVEEGGVRLEFEFNSNHEKIGMCLEPSTSNLMFIRVREFSELFAVRPPPNLFICVNQTSNFSRPATIRLIIHRVPSVGRNVREFSMSFAPRIEFEFLKPCFLFSFIFSRISRTQIHEFSTYTYNGSTITAFHDY